jgi:hypothetical protein
VVIPDEAGGIPCLLEAEDIGSLREVVYQKLLSAKSGWVYFITGTRSYLSSAKQSFKLKNEDGTIEEINNQDSLVFEANGRFSVLVPQ